MKLIELCAVTKSFQLDGRELVVLDGIDLSIEEGEFVAIMGPSGSGKTTCLEILGVLSRPSSGVYTFDGRAVQDLDDDALADMRATRMGFVFQSFNLMPRMSGVRNVALPLLYAGVPAPVREQRAIELMKRVGLGHRLDHRPSQLSGGERQRVAIARALVNDPRVILADEPTGNLDQDTGEEILQQFADLHRDGRTIVVVTHDPQVARHARRIVHLRDGRIVGDSRGD